MLQVTIARGAFRNPVPTLLVAVIIGIACLVLTSLRLDLQTDWSYLFREDDPYIQQIRRYKEKFPLPHDIAVLVDRGPLASRLSFLEQLQERLEAEPQFFSHAFYKLDLTYLRERGLFFLTNQQLDELESELTASRPYLLSLTQGQDFPTLLSLFEERLDSSDAQQRAQALGLAVRLLDQLLGRLASEGAPGPMFSSRFKTDDERQQRLFQGDTVFYNLLEDGETHLLLVKPTLSDDRVSPTGPSVDRIRTIISELTPHYPGLRIRVTGEPVLLTDERRTCGLDSIKSSTITLILITLLFTLGFGEFRRPAMAMLALVVGLTWTLGFTTLTVGHLNFITVTYISMLCGLGIDFGIHITFRYYEERVHGKPPDEALDVTARGTGLDTFIGAVSTAFALLVLLVTGFKGVAELGIIAGGGVLLCYAATIIILPALLALAERGSTRFERSALARNLGPLEQTLLANARWMVLGAVVISAMAVPLAMKVGFDYNLLHIQAQDLESIKTELQLAREGKTSVLSAISLAPNLEEARTRAKTFRGQATVHDVTTPSDLVPPQSDTRTEAVTRIITRIEGLEVPTTAPPPTPARPLSAAIDHLEETFLKAYPTLAADAATKEQAARMKEQMSRLRAALDERGPGPLFDAIDQTQLALYEDLRLVMAFLTAQKADPPTLEDIPEPLRVRLVGVEGDLAMLVRPAGNVWDRPPLVQFVRDISRTDPQVLGDPILMNHFEEVIGQTHRRTVWVTLAVVLLVMAVYLRSPSRVLLTFLPTALGVLWMVGFMGWWGIQFNPANFVALPMLVGVGSVFGIHVTHRIYELDTHEILTSSTGPAVILSALTTIAGFGSLLSAAHRGINSLGFVISTGMAANLLAALFFLPAIEKLSKESDPPED
ncbi:MAG: MMPL family transporter [Vulcanimicrobiota bacterium]